MSALEVLPMGACLLHGPLTELASRRLIKNVFWRFGAAGINAYTLDEAIQGIAFYRGERDIPPELKHLCVLEPSDDPRSFQVGYLDSAQVAVFENNSPVALCSMATH